VPLFKPEAAGLELDRGAARKAASPQDQDALEVPVHSNDVGAAASAETPEFLCPADDGRRNSRS
jgi:hypothetical protein